MNYLEKDRERRYEAANGLAMDIQRHLGNEPVMGEWWACPDSNREPKHYECSALTIELQAHRDMIS